MAKHIISFDLRADFACFKKPDINEGTILTFNSLHKPALLGVLGAIVGLKGYNKRGEFPEYYQAFKDLPIGIEPIEGFHEKGNFSKTNIKYTNTVGYANADGTLIITEQTLIKPAFRCYIMVDDEIEHQAILKERILNGESVYLPYLGKNEFSAWWDIETVKEYQYSEVKELTNSYEVSSLFIKNFTLKDKQEEEKDDFNFLDMSEPKQIFIFFERLPIGFDEKLFQYQLEKFSCTNINFIPSKILSSLYFLKDTSKYVQLF